MPGQSHNGMQCNEFDALMGDALDGVLSGTSLERFEHHGQQCQLCGPLLAEAREGQRWLQTLTEVEPPPRMVHNILAATTGIDSYRLGETAPGKPTWSDQVRGLAERFLQPVWSLARQPRFAMSFAMAFFSLSMALNVAGVKFADVRHVDLRPSTIRRNYYETSGRVVKYYENIRFVYEIESRVREFKRATTPAEPAPREHLNRDHKNDTSGEPDQKQQRNYSKGESEPIYACLPDDPPVVMGATYRRAS
ncbi:MAG: zf-HC2 domain-containing protein [Acidobacteriales bacterium]|nr:zf-HC2 domain-containing protein [Terriglobales bacterium]